MLAGESILRSLEGTWRVLVCATPYWRLRLQYLTAADLTL